MRGHRVHVTLNYYGGVGFADWGRGPVESVQGVALVEDPRSGRVDVLGV